MVGIAAGKHAWGSVGTVCARVTRSATTAIPIHGMGAVVIAVWSQGTHAWEHGRTGGAVVLETLAWQDVGKARGLTGHRKSATTGTRKAGTGAAGLAGSSAGGNAMEGPWTVRTRA